MFDDGWFFGLQEIITHIASGSLGAVIIWLPTKIRRMLLKPEVEQAYLHVQGACEPETLNPEHPGNPHAMTAIARNYVNLLRPKLKRAGLYPPESMSRSEDSISLWFSYLSDVRQNI